MRFTNFAAGCVSKVFSSILCILLGIVLALGGIVGGGYIAITRKGMVGTISDLAKNQGINVELDEDLRELSLLDWGKQLIPLFSAFTTTKIGEIEEKIGISTLSKTISDLTGISIDVVKESTLSEFGKTFSENMTVANASDKFGIEFPDLPAFQQESFLNSPLSTAFAQIDEFEIQDFVEVTEESSPILLNLADLKIGELSDPELGIDNRVNSLPLKDVITIVEEGENKSNSVLIKLKDTKVGELGTPETDALIKTMELQEVIDIVEGEATPVLWELRATPIGELGSPETDEQINNMKIADLMTIDSNSSKILQYFVANDVTLAGTDEFGEPTGINQALKVMRLKDMMTLTDPETPGGGSTKFMWALRDCPIETIPADGETPEILGVEDTLKITPLSELLDTSGSYIWQYLGATTIETIGAAVDDMRVADAIEITETSPPILRKMRVAVGEEDPTMFGSEDVKINELNTKLEPLILDLELGEILTITEPAFPNDPSASEPILVALKGVKIADMNDAISDLTIAEVFKPEDYESGVLALIDPNTPLNDVSGVVATAVKDGRLQKFINLDIVAEPTVSDVELQSSIRNKNVDGILASYSSMLNAIIANPSAPVNIASLAPTRFYLNSIVYFNGTIDMDLIEQLISIDGFEEGDTLVLDRDTTIAAENFTVLFNVMLNGYELTIESGATLRSADYDSFEDEYYNDRGGFMFISNDFHTGGITGQTGSLVGQFDDPADITLPNRIEIELYGID